MCVCVRTAHAGLWLTQALIISRDYAGSLVIRTWFRPPWYNYGRHTLLQVHDYATTFVALLLLLGGVNPIKPRNWTQQLGG